MHRLIVTALAGSSLTLAACGSPQPSGEAAPGEQTSAAPAPAGVLREEVPTPTPSPTPMVAAAIQTQPGPKNTTVALNRVAVTGDVLTVALTYSPGECCVRAPLDEVSVIDDATSQRLGVLKDNAGRFMAAPLNNDGKQLDLGSWRTPSQVWFKFPAPPATTKTVSIAIPDVAPFDAVPVTR